MTKPGPFVAEMFDVIMSVGSAQSAAEITNAKIKDMAKCGDDPWTHNPEFLTASMVLKSTGYGWRCKNCGKRLILLAIDPA